VLPDLVTKHPHHPTLKSFAPRIIEESPAEELYDLIEDPWQLRNLAGDPAHAKTKERLEKQMTDYQRLTGDPRVTGEMKIFEATRAKVVETKKSGYKGGE
jgi:arylsulfatase A-like enzyme